MPYNPQIHHRRSIRLKGYDYSQAGAYFITICCKDRKCSFGKIENGEMILNEFGQIAFDEWMKLPGRYSNFELDVFQIMPNHLHGIVVLVGAGLAPAQLQPQSGNGNDMNVIRAGVDDNWAGVNPAPTDPQPHGFVPTVGDMMGAYKSLVANECLKIWKSRWEGASPAPTMGKLWQQNFYEHIIRNEKSYKTISDYIVNNPKNWREDKFYNK